MRPADIGLKRKYGFYDIDACADHWSGRCVILWNLETIGPSFCRQCLNQREDIMDSRDCLDVPGNGEEVTPVAVFME
jgi:hypothetical protein